MDIMELGNHFQMLEDDEMFEEEEEEEEGEEEQSDEEQGEEEQGEEEEGEGPDNVNSLFTFKVLCMGCVIMIHYVINVAIDMQTAEEIDFRIFSVIIENVHLPISATTLKFGHLIVAYLDTYE